MTKIFAVSAGLLIVACSAPLPVQDAADARSRQDAVNRASPGYVVDSMLPVAVALHRFRVAIGGDSARAFSSASPSREALVSRFVGAIVARDTADLARMAMAAREFADLYYPSSIYAVKPYQQPPDLAWSLIQSASMKGLRLVLGRLAGSGAQYRGHVCADTVRRGAVTTWSSCVVTLASRNGSRTTARLFGSIVERDGEFKFVSYANGF